MRDTGANWALRGLLGALWIGNGLEKFGVSWPAWLLGGTGDVPGLLRTMSEESPVPLLPWLIDTFMLPLGSAITYTAGILELALAAALLTGVMLPWASMVGALIQIFFWLGFLTVDWPFQYPILILAHLALAVPALLQDRPWGAWERWEIVLSLALVALWVYDAATGRLISLLPGVFIAASLLPVFRAGRVAGGIGLAAGILFSALALPQERWDSFVWTYYSVIGVHGALLIGSLRRLRLRLR